MPSIDISIVKRDSAPPWDDVTGPIQIPPDEPWRIAIIEGGMQSGQASIALRLEVPDADGLGSSTVIAETSLSALIGVLAAARGAFPDAFVGGPFEAKR